MFSCFIASCSNSLILYAAHISNTNIMNSNSPRLSKLRRTESCISPCLTAILTFNFVLAAYQSIHKPLEIAFLLFCYSNLILLFRCLNKLKTVPENSVQWKWLHVGVWSFSTILVTSVTYRVGSIMSPTVKVLVWSMGGICVFTSFYACFLQIKNSGVESKEQSLGNTSLHVLPKGQKFESCGCVV